MSRPIYARIQYAGTEQVLVFSADDMSPAKYNAARGLVGRPLSTCRIDGYTMHGDDVDMNVVATLAGNELSTIEYLTRYTLYTIMKKSPGHLIPATQYFNDYSMPDLVEAETYCVLEVDYDSVT